MILILSSAIPTLIPLIVDGLAIAVVAALVARASGTGNVAIIRYLTQGPRHAIFLSRNERRRYVSGKTAKTSSSVDRSAVRRAF